MAWTSKAAALATMTAFRASRSPVSIHDVSDRDASDLVANVMRPLTAQYTATAATTTPACPTHSKGLGTRMSRLSTKPQSRAVAGAVTWQSGWGPNGC